MTAELFLELEYVDMSKADELEKIFRKHKLPLERIGLVDNRTGELFLAEGGRVQFVSDPMTGDAILLNPDFEMKFILHVALSSDCLVDSAFINDQGELVDKHENQLILTPYDSVPWTQALLTVTFGPGS
jgi:hypothetical protein